MYTLLDLERATFYSKQAQKALFIAPSRGIDDGVPVFDCMRVCRLPAQIQNGTKYRVVVFDANPAAAPENECVCARWQKCKVHRILSCSTAIHTHIPTSIRFGINKI